MVIFPGSSNNEGMIRNKLTQLVNGKMQNYPHLRRFKDLVVDGLVCWLKNKPEKPTETHELMALCALGVINEKAGSKEISLKDKSAEDLASEFQAAWHERTREAETQKQGVDPFTRREGGIGGGRSKRTGIPNYKDGGLNR
jgi:hypothetical protein